jgi:SAM-dependent methyltransferase
MVKYWTIALLLKGFSCASPVRGLYRQLGNRVGGRRRETGVMPDYYIDRLKRMLRLAKEHGIVRDGDRILELGTGWLHWEALTLRLFYDIEAVLYDVWDNRQLGGLKNYVQQLSTRLNTDFALSPGELKRAQSLIAAILKVESFSQLYDLLGFQYVVESSGSLAQFADRSFDLVVSAGVLEHVKREALPILVEETRRVLKPGGWAVHSIDTSDHLSHYDGSVSKKKYLSFSEATWKRLCENEVQYINRVQRSDWLKLFRASGFELIEEENRRVDIAALKVAENYRSFDPSDLACTVVRFAFKAPQPVASAQPRVLTSDR